MANKKNLKKEINQTFIELIEDAFSYQLEFPGKKDKEVNALIEEAASALEDLLGKINATKSLGSGKETKKQYAVIRKEYAALAIDIGQKVNKLG
jgi:hypothetical protein